jgi:hypothetical protein
MLVQSSLITTRWKKLQKTAQSIQIKMTTSSFKWAYSWKSYSNQSHLGSTSKYSETCLNTNSLGTSYCVWFVQMNKDFLKVNAGCHSGFSLHRLLCSSYYFNKTSSFLLYLKLKVIFDKKNQMSPLTPLQLLLCSLFQCLSWHSLLQYNVTWHWPHLFMPSFGISLHCAQTESVSRSFKMINRICD